MATLTVRNLDEALRIDHTIHDTLYVALALATGADALILDDKRFEAKVMGQGNSASKL